MLSIPRGGTPALTTPCHREPSTWLITVDEGRDAAAAIWRAATGCAECRITHPSDYDSCRTAPPDRAIPLSVMAGDVIGSSGARIRPSRYIRSYLPKLTPDPDDAAERASA